jgi:hypothetical protein
VTTTKPEPRRWRVVGKRQATHVVMFVNAPTKQRAIEEATQQDGHALDEVLSVTEEEELA